jgi:DNA-binding transcriptional LysR family regulator
MELRHLRYFVAVAEEQSITRAAERLWIAQPGLSQQVRALEQELGVALFVRHSRGVTLTDAGERLLDLARVAVAAFEAALASGRDSACGLAGHIRLGIATAARSGLGPALLEAFRSVRPAVELSVVEAHSDKLLRDVRDGRLDAAIVFGPVAQPELESIHLRQERVLVALGAGHRLASQARISPDQLDGETVVISGDRDGAGYDRRVAHFLGAASVHVKTHKAGFGAAMLRPVRSGAAVALLSRSGADLGTGIVARPLDAPVAFHFDLAWTRGAPAPALGALLDCGRHLAATRLRVHPGGRRLSVASLSHAA